MEIGEAVKALGLPHDMFTWRGEDASRDNVVFFYPDAVYLFWFRDRVWQVRFDRRYGSPVLGLTLGMSREQVLSIRAGRVFGSGDSLYFDLDSPDFPVRVRLVFEVGFLTDVYVYRSDY